MTEPPAAPALVLLATETTELVDIRGSRYQMLLKRREGGALRRPPSVPSSVPDLPLSVLPLRQLLEQREDVLRDGIGLSHHRSARLLQNLRLRQVGGRLRVVRIHDRALRGAEVRRVRVQARDGGLEPVLVRAEVRAARGNLLQRVVDR